MQGRPTDSLSFNSIMSMTSLVAMAALMLLTSCTVCDGSAPGSSRRLLQVDDSSSAQSSFRMTMMHRDHVDSPLRDASGNYSFTERLKSAIARGKVRSKSVRRVIAKLTESNSSHPREAELLGVKSKVASQQGEYVVNFQLGTPPQSFVAILDSGSDLNWVQCSTRKSRINTPNPPFNPSTTSTYKKSPCGTTFCNSLPLPRISCTSTCEYQYGYGDGTTSIGDLSLETLQLASTTGGYRRVPNFAFGCGQENYGDLAGSDGIVGIGQGPLSMPSQLGSVVGKRFAFCLVGMYEATTTTSPLVIGGDAFWPSNGSLWTPIVKNARSPTYYYLQVECIKIAGKCLSIPASAFNIASNGAGGTILDTGTTMTELLPAAYNVLIAGLKTAVKFPQMDGSWYGFDLCFDTSSSVAAPVFPKISFRFSWSDFTLPDDNVFLNVDVDVYCLAINSGYGINIIGNIQLQNFYVFVNKDTNVIGWKPAQCDTIK
ncbi:hypothetical protein MPTK2_3g18040 [Marchantia polymorpha subsp. ruderalis]